MLRTLHRLEANERDLHRQNRSDAIQNTISHIDPMRKPSSGHQRQHMQWNQINEEDVASPRRHHIEIGQRRHCRPQDRSRLHRFYPKVIRQQHTENGNAFVVVGSGNRSGNVSGNDGDHCGGHQTGALAVDLFGQQIGDDRCEGGEERSEEDAYVPDVDGDVEQPHQTIEYGRCDHQAGINRAADDPSQRIPGSVIEPIVEVVESLFGQEARRPVIEVRIEFVDDAFESEHREQTSGECFARRKTNHNPEERPH